MSEIIRAELRRRGWTKTLAIPAMTAGALHQYSRDDDSLRPGIRAYGAFNLITVMNLDDTSAVKIRLDYSTDRIVIAPPGAVVTMDQITYQDFQVENIGAATIAVDKVFVTVGFERSLLRDERDMSGAMSGYGGRA